MKNINKLIIIILLLSSFLSFSQSINENDGTTKILVILPNNLGGNFNFAFDDLEFLGWDVTFTGLTEIINTCSWPKPLGHINFQVDTLIQDIDDVTNWDVLVLMNASSTGNAYGDILNSQEAMNLFVQANDNNMVIWATCAGVRVLAAADIINGVNVTGKSNFSSEYIAAGANYLGPEIPPVIDDNIVTSTKGRYFHYQNIEAILTALIGMGNKGDMQFFPIKNTSNNEGFKNDLLWSKEIGGEHSEGGRSVIKTSDDGFLVCGHLTIPGFNTVLMLIKTDSEGNTEWSSGIGGNGWEYGNSVCELQGGGYAVCGLTSSEGNGLEDFFVIKVNSHGQQVWRKTYGGTGLDIASSICETFDKKLLVCGYTESFGAGEDDIYVLKLNENGNEIWSKTFGGSASELGRKIVELSDGNYAVMGCTGSYGAGKRDIYLIKTDSDGNEIWSKTYGDSRCQDAFSFKETSDGGFIIAGHSDTSSDLLEAYLVKTDSEGVKIWNNTYEGSDNFYDYAKDVIETDNGNFLVCGHTKIRLGRKNEALLFLVDPNGNEIWKEEYGGMNSDWAHSICCTKDGGFVVTGHTGSNNSGDYNVWLFKIQNPLASIEENTNPQRNFLFQNTPNPVKNKTLLKVVISEDSNSKLIIYNLNGEIIKSFKKLGKGSHTILWDLTDNYNRKVPSGMYYLNLKSANESLLKKIIVVGN